ncbi:thiamine-phosphate kinase [Acidocella aromatica]|uniref:Thiamine-monophosphate kinase n=1 Tax=Acidocella aromatica TaxID=1303579 RepID=A0A840VH89_9PROT|nr:thiamine-phosphate kinase [Acidocella aromatica]MBB5372565.1 thiamine-monophosphate kinase [Acidocella aromatica]
MPDEFSRIARYFAPLAGEAGLGLKDDAAVLAPPQGRELVLTVDQMLEGVHFLPGDDPALIARKLLRRNLSDLAAMGAVPLGYLLTTALPAVLSEDWLAGFAAGLAQDQKAFGLKLLGGDSSSSLHEISLTATLLGTVAPGAALRRNGARAGDEIWVTGTIGDAVLGLQARLGQREDPTGFFIRRSLLPEPRVGLALAGLVTAAIDVSDGLVQDLAHIAEESGLGAVIEASLVPVSPEAAALGDSVLQARLTGGDDYELILAVPPGKDEALRAACGAVAVTKIGVFEPGAGVRVCAVLGDEIPLKSLGWKHF